MVSQKGNSANPLSKDPFIVIRDGLYQAYGREVLRQSEKGIPIQNLRRKKFGG